MQLEDTQFHVVYLTNLQQVVIRTALMDFCGDKIWKSVSSEILNLADAQEKADTIYRETFKIMQRYESLIACMTSIDSKPAKKGQLFYFDSMGMEWIQGALNSFDATNTYADKDKIEMTSKGLETTRSHLAMAANFTYTPEYVRRILKDEGAK